MTNRVTSGQDVLIIKGRVFADYADANPIDTDYSEDGATIHKYKNGNIIITVAPAGSLITLTVKLLMGSDDDKFLNTEYKSFRTSPNTYTLMDGSYVKNSGDGAGNVNQVIMNLVSGFVMKPPKLKENTEGDADQEIATWTLKFDTTNGRDMV